MKKESVVPEDLIVGEPPIEDTQETNDGIEDTQETNDGIEDTQETNDGIEDTQETNDGIEDTQETNGETGIAPISMVSTEEIRVALRRLAAMTLKPPDFKILFDSFPRVFRE